jgi:excisionase family DNA binding protein
MQMLNIQKLSALLNVKQKTIYDWCHRKKIPYYKLEGCLRFDENEILKWLRSKKQYPYKH